MPSSTLSADVPAAVVPTDVPAATPRVGVDLVEIAAIARSLDDFGARFLNRLFTPAEQAAVRVGDRVDAARVATRFAAKEAAIKALGLGADGLGWRELEVVGGVDSAPRLVLHGSAAIRARALGLDPAQLAVSLSHEAGMACAMVVGVPESEHASRP